MAINARFSKVVRSVWIWLIRNFCFGIRAMFWLSWSPWLAPGGCDRASGGIFVLTGHRGVYSFSREYNESRSRILGGQHASGLSVGSDFVGISSIGGLHGR